MTKTIDDVSADELLEIIGFIPDNNVYYRRQFQGGVTIVTTLEFNNGNVIMNCVAEKQSYGFTHQMAMPIQMSRFLIKAINLKLKELKV